MSPFEWLTIFFVCLIGAMTPGPSLIVIIYLTNSKNFISGFIASLAHGFGIFVYALISIFSLSMIVSILPSIIPIIQILGAIFLIYVGSKILLLKTSGKEVDNKIKLPKAANAVEGFNYFCSSCGNKSNQWELHCPKCDHLSTIKWMKMNDIEIQDSISLPNFAPSTDKNLISY